MHALSVVLELLTRINLVSMTIRYSVDISQIIPHIITLLPFLFLSCAVERYLGYFRRTQTTVLLASHAIFCSLVKAFQQSQLRRKYNEYRY